VSLKGIAVTTENQTEGLENLKIDTQNLYREEMLTDLKSGSIRQLIPVTLDGKNDTSRRLIFVGQTQVMTQMGPLPVQGPIEARTLKEAIEKFPEAIQAAIETMVEEAREAQRQEASRIVVPGAEATSKILTGPDIK
jgi:hypothetical protein